MSDELMAWAKAAAVNLSQCAARIEELEADRDAWRVRAEQAESRVTVLETMVAELEARARELKDGLHRISLGAQNSSSTTHGLGREARATIERTDKNENRT